MDPASRRAAGSIVAFAAGHPAPVVGPAAPAVLKVADVTAAAAAIPPREVAAAPVVRTVFQPSVLFGFSIFLYCVRELSALQ